MRSQTGAVDPQGTSQPSLSHLAFHSLIQRLRYSWLYLPILAILAHIFEPRIRDLLVWKIFLVLFLLNSLVDWYLVSSLSDPDQATGWRLRIHSVHSPFDCFCASVAVTCGYIRFGFDRNMITATLVVACCAFGAIYVLRPNYRFLRSIVLAWFLPVIGVSLYLGSTTGYEVALFSTLATVFCLHQGKIESREFWRLLHANRELDLARKQAETSALLEAELLADRMYQEGILTERNRIAAELHDTLSAGFSAIKLQIDVAANCLTPKPARSESALTLARSMLRHYHNEARQSIAELQRPLLSQSFSDSLHQALEPLCQGCAVDFNITAPDDSPPLSPDQLHQTLRIAQEALRNALQHGSPKSITVAAHRAGPNLVLEVADDGSGFEPGPRPNGHFGLEIMKDRARKIGASLKISSQPGRGTCVQLTLPANDSLKPFKILVVDDQLLVRVAVRSMLEEQGAQPSLIREADTAKDALALIEKDPPAVAIIDLRLPDSSGIDLIQQIRASAFKFPIVVFSDYTGGEHLRTAIKSGAAAYVTKDSAAELPAAIRSVLSGGRYFPKSFAGLIDKRKLLYDLNPAERDVLEQMISGFDDREIAYRLGISLRSVRQRINGLLGQYSVRDRKQLLRLISFDGSISQTLRTSGPVLSSFVS